MLKGLSRLWWRGVKSISKVQQSQNKKLVKALLAKPAKSLSRKGTTVTTPSVKSKAAPAKQTLPGQWLSFYDVSAKKAPAVPGRRMQYWLYLPASAGTASLPLVVMLHGCNQSVDDFARGTRMNQLAEKQGFAVLYPQQSLTGHPKRCWNWYNKDTQAGGGDAKCIAGIISKISDKFAIDKTRVYIAGLSAGASMASIVALNYPHLITAVGIHSGTVFGAGHSIVGAYAVMQRGSVKGLSGAVNNILRKHVAFPKMPVMLIHGLDDNIVRPVNVRQLAQQFRALNQVTEETEATVTFKAASTAQSRHPHHPYNMYEYYESNELLVKVCEIFQLGHAWSGGDCKLRYNACTGPDATRMLWQFFRQHRRVEAP